MVLRRLIAGPETVMQERPNREILGGEMSGAHEFGKPRRCHSPETQVAGMPNLPCEVSRLACTLEGYFLPVGATKVDLTQRVIRLDMLPSLERPQ